MAQSEANDEIYILQLGLTLIMSGLLRQEEIPPTAGGFLFVGVDYFWVGSDREPQEKPPVCAIWGGPVFGDTQMDGFKRV